MSADTVKGHHFGQMDDVNDNINQWFEDFAAEHRTDQDWSDDEELTEPVISVDEATDDTDYDLDLSEYEITEEPGSPVNHPEHYASVVPGIECIQVTQWFNFNRGNAIKYLWRAGSKGGDREHAEDLRKAIKYINFELERLKELGIE